MLDIQLVKVVRNGVTILVGRRYQDRWNLESLGIYHTLIADRNQSTVKKLRRLYGLAFTFSVVRAKAGVVSRPLPMDTEDWAMVSPFPALSLALVA